MRLRHWLSLAAAAFLAACSGNTATQKQGSSSSSSSSGGSGGSGSASSSGSSGSASSSGATTSASSSGSHSSSSASSGSHSGSSSSSSSSSSGSSGGSCWGDNEYVGAGNGAQCCSGVEVGGYCSPSGGSSSSSGSGTSSGSSGNGICTTQRCVVYAQTAQDLYEIDPANPNSATHLCAFSGIGADVFDIAVRADGTLFALTANELYQVDPNTCAGTFLASLSSGNSFNSLAFTIGGTLIAADSIYGQVDSIDPNTGATQLVGTYGNNLVSSGDLVTLSNGTIYATALDLTGSATSDVLVTLDPSTYHATVIGPIGYNHIYGLAYWAGTLYGFDEGGDVIQIDPTTAQATPLAGAHSALPWYGAGTTPQAPIVNR